MLEVGAEEVAAPGVARLGQPGEHDVPLVGPDLNSVPVYQAVVGKAVLLQVAEDLRGLRGIQIVVERFIGPVPGPEGKGRDGHNKHRQGDTQYDAHLGAHVFEKVLDLLPKTFQLCCIHSIPSGPFYQLSQLTCRRTLTD